MRASPLKIRKTRFARAESLRDGWLNPDPRQVARIQLERLKEVWRDATENVPYFQRLLEQRKAPRDLHSITQFTTDVPVLTREQILAEPHLFVRDGNSPDRKAMTAGSTGNPLQFGIYSNESELVAPDLIVGRIANGLEISDRVFLLWGHSHLLGTGLKGKGKNTVRRIKDRLLGYYRADAYHLDPASAKAHLQSLLKFRPKVVVGYSTALDMLVRYNQEFVAEVRKLRIKFVVGTAENLPRADSLEAIESFFGCPFVMEYGGVEFGPIAHSMPGQPYRVYWWNSLVETLAEMGTAAPGSQPIVVTALYQRYFPVVRYRNGDEVRGATSLSDGQTIGFSEVCGRHNDAITLSNGSAIHSVGLFHCIHQEPQVFNIQLVIDNTGLRLLLVAATSDTSIITRIRRRLLDLNPALANCAIEFVPDLVTNRAGKRRWVIDAR